MACYSSTSITSKLETWTLAYTVHVNFAHWHNWLIIICPNHTVIYMMSLAHFQVLPGCHGFRVFFLARDLDMNIFCCLTRGTRNIIQSSRCKALPLRPRKRPQRPRTSAGYPMMAFCTNVCWLLRRPGPCPGAEAVTAWVYEFPFKTSLTLQFIYGAINRMPALST